jgi:hypothetical protein
MLVTAVFRTNVVALAAQKHPQRRQSRADMDIGDEENGASDGARTRDLRRDRPAL